jgi:glutaconyl-CoA/methylmalonyl-CoA decarboxylase subunit delta
MKFLINIKTCKFRKPGGGRMGSTINFSETLIIALGSMAIILAILLLYAISLVAKLSKAVGEKQSEGKIEQNPVLNFAYGSAAAQSAVQTLNDIEDKEDRLVAALAASAMASEDKSGSHFRISKITRIK